ncbi:uncharacterized protein Z520_00261 [Fonsecaea multimorphosa CBS 102226]|uniref:SHSP domain-containing protein n=1 Tax=Fonsecaea multimorphosa CBS 102226 TaxID=1442371 RepID=A0A0D2KJ99_9EURO|nr:uncharacterized protein Z520_00261 [Fonsecaea multimorphosa CBS 102226]KIY03570.1 hypothetical protein Z520_00261 [Fonsecaea multimorphosa CBS 102226]OAL32272.1 hypothetical protein AYO22_00294 [Fonsecaea multimorphosa]
MATLDCLLHPHHISLVDTHSLRAKLHHVGDAYYNVDGLPSHRGVLAPKFDVFELDGDSAGWLLVGDLPGIDSADAIKIEWLDGSTVFLRGTITTSSIPTFGEAGSRIMKTVHKERHEGLFERSVTLPGKADIKGTKVEVRSGVVFVRIPKQAGAEAV